MLTAQEGKTSQQIITKELAKCHSDISCMWRKVAQRRKRPTSASPTRDGQGVPSRSRESVIWIEKARLLPFLPFLFWPFLDPYLSLLSLLSSNPLPNLQVSPLKDSSESKTLINTKVLTLSLQRGGLSPTSRLEVPMMDFQASKTGLIPNSTSSSPHTETMYCRS